MGLTTSPVKIRDSTYLPVPRDVAELLRVMATRTCSVNFRIDEKGCSLVYTFAKPLADTVEESADPMLIAAQ